MKISQFFEQVFKFYMRSANDSPSGKIIKNNIAMQYYSFFKGIFSAQRRAFGMASRRLEAAQSDDWWVFDEENGGEDDAEWAEDEERVNNSRRRKKESSNPHMFTSFLIFSPIGKRHKR